MHGRFDGGKVVEIEIQEFQPAPGGWVVGFVPLDCIHGFGLGASCNVDAGILLEKDLCQLQADAAISARNNENLHRCELVQTRLSLRQRVYLVCLVWAFLLGKYWWWREKLAVGLAGTHDEHDRLCDMLGNRN